MLLSLLQHRLQSRTLMHTKDIPQLLNIHGNRVGYVVHTTSSRGQPCKNHIFSMWTYKNEQDFWRLVPNSDTGLLVKGTIKSRSRMHEYLMSLTSEASYLKYKFNDMHRGPDQAQKWTCISRMHTERKRKVQERLLKVAFRIFSPFRPLFWDESLHPVLDKTLCGLVYSTTTHMFPFMAGGRLSKDIWFCMIYIIHSCWSEGTIGGRGKREMITVQCILIEPGYVGGPAAFSRQVVWALEVPPGPLLLSEKEP